MDMEMNSHVGEIRKLCLRSSKPTLLSLPTTALRRYAGYAHTDFDSRGLGRTLFAVSLLTYRENYRTVPCCPYELAHMFETEGSLRNTYYSLPVMVKGKRICEKAEM